MVSRVANTIRRGRPDSSPVVELLAIVMNFAFDISFTPRIPKIFLSYQ